MTSLLRKAERVLAFQTAPEFPRTSEGLRDKADWMDRRDEAFRELADCVRPRMKQVNDRVWRRFDSRRAKEAR